MTSGSLVTGDSFGRPHPCRAGETVAGEPLRDSAGDAHRRRQLRPDLRRRQLHDHAEKPASVTPNPDDQGLRRTPTRPSPGALSGFLAADGVTATYTRTAGETVAGSPYTISATLGADRASSATTRPLPTTPPPSRITPEGGASVTRGQRPPRPTAPPTRPSPGALHRLRRDRERGHCRDHRERLLSSAPPARPSQACPYTITCDPRAGRCTGQLHDLDLQHRPVSTDYAEGGVGDAGPACKIYGDADPALTGTLTGFLASTACRRATRAPAARRSRAAPTTLRRR